MKNILLIDEQIWISELLKEFSSKRYDVTVVPNAKNFLGYIKSNQYDLVLLSFYLKYGYQAWEVIKTIKRTNPQLPVIILASNEKYLDEPIFKAADGYVVKGWSAGKELIQKVSLILNKKSAKHKNLLPENSTPKMEEVMTLFPQIKRILYTTDLSPNSTHVLRHTVNSAKKHGAKIVALHVIDNFSPTTANVVGSYLTHDQIDQISEGRIAFAKERLLKRIELLCEREPKSVPIFKDVFETVEVVAGHPADEIIKQASEFDCDAIAMGTHSKGFFKHSYLGSAAKQVLRRTNIPIMITPIPEGDIDFTTKDG